MLEGAIIKRRSFGRQDGLAVIAEGVAAKMDPAELARASGVDVGYDAHGNIRLEKIPLASIIEREMVRRSAERGEALPLVSVTLGYELRCAAPIPFDIDYTRTLGYGAVRFLLGQRETERTPSGGVVCLENGRLRVLPFEELQDPDIWPHSHPHGRHELGALYGCARVHASAGPAAISRTGRPLANLRKRPGWRSEDFVTRFSPVVESDSVEQSKVGASA